MAAVVDVGLNLRDLMSSGRLPAMFESMGVSRFEAAGVLAFFYEATQDAELVRASVTDFEAVARVKVRPYRVADLLVVLTEAGLADDHGDGTYTIRGNEAHVAKLRTFRERAAKGGHIRAKKQLEAAGKQLKAAAPAASSSPGDWLLDPGSGAPNVAAPVQLAEQARLEFDSRGGSISRSASQNALLPAKKQRSPAEQQAARQVRQAFMYGYEERYRRPLEAWGAPENAHVYHLLKTWPADRLTQLAIAYFAWPRPECIKAGHPFMKHPASFSAKLHELAADIVAPERRAEAASVKHQEHQHDFRAELEAQDERVLRQLREERRDGIMGRPGATGHERDASQLGAQPALRDPLAPAVGRSEEALDPALAPAGGVFVVPRS